MTPKDNEVVEREVRVAARPDAVFAFLTDSEKMARWMGSAVTVDPRPGGTYRVAINEHYVARGEYVEVVPHSRVVFTWGWEGEGGPVPPGSSTVEITLVPDGDGTVVRLRHSDLPPDGRASHADGWEHYLARLATAGTGQDPGPDPWAATSSEDAGSMDRLDR